MINNEVTIDLTKREVQVVKLICKELTNKEIAEKLGLKVRTI
jgi:DNA-binding CsgD family transcriptional regulator